MSRLAVFTPHIGARSETFIRRHIEDLYPGRVVVATHRFLTGSDAAWGITAPAQTAIDLSFDSARYGRYLERLVPNWFADAYYRRRVFDWLEKWEVSAFLGQYLHKSWPFIELARERGIRFYAHAHGYDLSTFWHREPWRYRYRDYRHVHGVIVVNQIMKQRLLEAGVPSEEIHIVPYGVTVPGVKPTRTPDGECRWLAVGRMVGKKAPLKTLEAFKFAHSRASRMRLDFIGTGPLFSASQEYVASNRMDGYIALHGGLSHDYVLNSMQSSDAFVQHSLVDPISHDEEGAPVAILEAMAHGLPVVATRHAGIPEVVEHGVTGLLVEEGDVEGMAAALVELSNSPELRHRLGTAGWERARERFTWNVERDRLRAILGL